MSTFASPLSGVTQKVINTNEHTRRTPANQADDTIIRKPMKIGAATPYDFKGSHLTPYGGLLPVTTMLEKLGFQELIERHVTVKRLTTSMPGFRFVLAMILALYVGWSRLNHLRFLQREPMLTGILGVDELPVQSTFWRFLGSLHLVVARQLLEVMRCMRQRVWEAAHVQLKQVTLDTDTTVQTVYGRRKMGARKGYNPKHRGKRSYQPILTFLAETREYISGELRKGERPTANRSRRIWTTSSPCCRKASRDVMRTPTRDCTAGTRWRAMRNTDAGSCCRCRRVRAWWKN